MRRIVLVAAAAVALATGGCMALATNAPTLGAPGYVYQGGKAAQGFSFPMQQVQTAVLEAMSDLRFHDVKQTHDLGMVSFDGRTADGRRANVTVESQNKLPVVAVRIGWLGDEPLSKALMDRVGIRLGTLPPEAIPTDPPSEPTSHSLFVRPKSNDPGLLPVQGEMGYHDSPIPDSPRMGGTP